MRKRNKATFGYFIRGFGIGILFTTIISVVHTNRLQEEYAPLSKDEIIEKAKEYGMVEALDQKLDALEKDNDTESVQSTPLPTTASSEQTENKTELTSQESENSKETSSKEESSEAKQENKEDEENKKDKENIDNKIVKLVINKGDSLKEVARKLKKDQVIKDEVEFRQYFNKKNLGSKVMVGEYKIPIGYSYSDIAKLITK